MYSSFAGRWPALRLIRSLLDQNDSLYRLPSTVLEQMLRDPSSHRFPRYAGCGWRIRSMAEFATHKRSEAKGLRATLIPRDRYPAVR